jgi:DNA-binding response OmpR family regulator
MAVVTRAHPGPVPHPAPGAGPPRILVVADAAAVATAIARALREAGYEVTIASRATPVRDVLLDGGTYDLIALDIGLPAAQGLAVLRTLRAWGVATPVLLVTDGTEVGDTVRGLDLGADDVAARRCTADELKARVAALLRRSRGRPTSVWRVGDLVLDPGRRQAARGGRAITLSPREYTLLEYLMRNPDRVVTRTTILDHVWGLAFARESNLVEVYVSYLRRKIETPGQPRLLHTLRGLGYMLSAEG